MSSRYQIWRLTNVLRGGHRHSDYDALYIPRVGYTTGHLDVHDVAVDSDGRLVFVSAMFCCLGTLSDHASFQPLWRPSFVSRLTPEDRCHLNGLALRDGRPRYVTAVAQTDVPEGWRDHRRDGGSVMDVEDGSVILEGLSMPHSPRWYRERLWVLNSGCGQFGFIDTAKGTFEAVAFCPGYLRGLVFVGDYAIVTLSLPRQRAFDGLALGNELEKRKASAQCGLYVININTGQVEHTLRLKGLVSELYDVVTLPGITRPRAIGFKTKEIERMVQIDEAGTL